MQNYVKRNITPLLISVAVFLLLFVTLCLPFDQFIKIPVKPTDEPNSTVFEQNGVTYIGNRTFEVSDYTLKVAKGDQAHVTVSATTSTEVDITVYYPSGASTSSVFVPKLATKDQNAVWEWKIPSNTSADKIRIVLKSADTLAQLYIDII